MHTPCDCESWRRPSPRYLIQLKNHKHIWAVTLGGFSPGRHELCRTVRHPLPLAPNLCLLLALAPCHSSALSGGGGRLFRKSIGLSLSACLSVQQGDLDNPDQNPLLRQKSFYVGPVAAEVTRSFFALRGEISQQQKN